MLKLAKAELYRFFKSGIFSKILIGLSVLIPIVNLVVAWAFKIHDKSLDIFLTESQMPLLMIALLAFPTVFCVYNGTAYNSRLAYYEIMDGNKPLKIVATKILSLGLTVSTIMYVPFALMCGIVGAVNGFGEIENPVLFFVLVFVLFAHIVIAAMLYSMFSRNLILSSFVPYIRFGIIDLFLAMYGETYFMADGKEVPDIMNIFIFNQLSHITGTVYSNSFVVYTIVGALLEIAVLSLVVIMVYRKKKFK